MKSSVKNVYILLAGLAAVAMAATSSVGLGAAYAEEDGGQAVAQFEELSGSSFAETEGSGALLSDESATDFSCTVRIAVQSGGQAGGIAFGAQQDGTYMAAYADFSANALYISRIAGGEIQPLASAQYSIEGADECTLSLEVRGEVISLNADGGEMPEVVVGADGYVGGLTGLYACRAAVTAAEAALEHLDVSAQYEGSGDISFDVGGYAVRKVVNVTDASYRLEEGEYSLADGKLTISAAYLGGLSASGTYVIRAVCEERDLDFTVTTSFTGAAAQTSKPEFAPDEQVVITVEGADSVNGIRIDGAPVAEDMYTVSGGTITLSPALGLIDGSHSAVILTDFGRPEVNIVVARPYDDGTVAEEHNFTYFIVDMTIFVLFIGACIFAPVIGKKLKKAE